MENDNQGGDWKEDGNENEKILELMIENKVLNCEKNKAESEVEVWKAKCTQLQLRVIELETTLASKCLSDTPKTNTQPLDHLADRDEGKTGELEKKSRVRKSLPFVIEGGPTKKMAPSTPVGVKPVVHGVINIDDSDDDDDTDAGLKSSKSNIHEDDNMVFVSTPGKRRSYNVIMSDVESDDNDDVPLSSLLKNRNKEQKRELNDDLMDEIESSGNEHRLRRLRKCKEKSVSPGNKEDSSETESEGESLNGFIVSNSDNESESDDNEDASSTDTKEDMNLDYKEIISRLRRNKDHTMKWEFEADMLAAFSNDPELCIKAVCALYRQQTCEEKFVKGTLVHNGRGFSHCDALRGSKLAQFVIDGDPQNDVKKSVEDLQKYDSKGLEVCRQLASRYSKQLFEIYKSKEDPLFLPC